LAETLDHAEVIPERVDVPGLKPLIILMTLFVELKPHANSKEPGQELDKSKDNRRFLRYASE
jgi:hypothetical protein